MANDILSRHPASPLWLAVTRGGSYTPAVGPGIAGQGCLDGMWMASLSGFEQGGSLRVARCGLAHAPLPPLTPRFSIVVPVLVAIVMALKDGKFPSTYRCTKAVVNGAFPGLLDQPFDLRYIK